MSLQTDTIFVKALRSDETLIAKLPAGDVYNTAIALPEEEALNAPLPYIIVSYDGLNNQDWTKDDSYDGNTDRVTIGIEIAAQTRPDLAELAIQVRDTIRDYFNDYEPTDDDSEEEAEDAKLIPNDTQLTASPVQYDDIKPCYWQRLTYQCDTNPD